MDEHQNELLLGVCKKAYRKHVLDDEDVGWDELGNELATVLSDTMGSQEFCDWLDEIGPDKAVTDPDPEETGL